MTEPALHDPHTADGRAQITRTAQALAALPDEAWQQLPAATQRRYRYEAAALHARARNRP